MGKFTIWFSVAIGFTALMVFGIRDRASKEAQAAAAYQAKKSEVTAALRAGSVGKIVSAVGEHELISLRIPVRSVIGSIDYRKCWVWRDAAFKTTSMHCDANAEVDLDAGEEYEPADERIQR